MSKCRDTEHNYVLANKSSYYKQAKNGKTTDPGPPKYELSVAYQMLFCTKCGDTKEIVACDHRESSGTS